MLRLDWVYLQTWMMNAEPAQLMQLYQRNSMQVKYLAKACVTSDRKQPAHLKLVWLLSEF